MRQLVAALALAGLACGGSEPEAEAQAAAVAEQPAAEEQAAPEQAGTGTVHEVRMELVDGEYRYEPKELTIKLGDTVRWLNINGFPHNVAFYEDKIPEGAADDLNALMPDKMSRLTGQLLTGPNEVYEMTFQGVPAGMYEYFCVPHEMLGMVATLTIEE